MSQAELSALSQAPSPVALSLRPYAAFLSAMARKYHWWLSPEEALENPERIAAMVMNIGEFRDAVRLSETVGEDILRLILRLAEAGQFNERSWHYWHYRLGLAEPGRVPPLPVRRIP
mgnify:FL=1